MTICNSVISLEKDNIRANNYYQELFSSKSCTFEHPESWIDNTTGVG